MSSDIQAPPDQKQSFLQNVADLTEKYGLPVASLAFVSGNAWLLHQLDLDAQTHWLRHLLAPACSIAGNIAGLLNRKRNANTGSLLGSAALTSSGAGLDFDGFHPGMFVLNALGVCVAWPGSNLAPPKQIQKEDKDQQLQSVFQSGLLQTAGLQAFGNVLQVGIAYLDNLPGMVGPACCWLGASIIKTTQAYLEAKGKVRTVTPE